MRLLVKGEKVYKLGFLFQFSVLAVAVTSLLTDQSHVLMLGSASSHISWTACDKRLDSSLPNKTPVDFSKRQSAQEHC